MRPDPAVAAALALGDRTATHATRLGGATMSGQVQSWSLERSYETDLPPAMRAFSGSASAQLTLELSGTADKNAPALYGPWAPHGSADAMRPGQSVVHAWGVNDTNLPAFRGTVRSRTAASGSDTVTVTALDGAERLRTPAQLPSPSIGGITQRYIASTTWCADHLLRNAGFHSCPPPRPDCLLYASLHGGELPNIGSLYYLNDHEGWTDSRVPWSSALQTSTSSGVETAASWVPRTRISSWLSGGLWMEVWADNQGTSAGGRAVTIEPFWVGYSETGADRVTFTVDFVAGTARFGVGAGSASWSFPQLQSQSGRWHLAGHVAFDSTHGRPTVTPYLTAPNGTLLTGTPSTFASQALLSGTLGSVGLRAAGLRLEALQLAKMPTRPTGDAITQRGRWVRSAYLDKPICPLQTIPRVTGTTWEVLTEIASATLSTLELREDGTVRWRNPTRFASVPATTDLTVTSARDIAALTITDEIDACRNQVKAPWESWQGMEMDGEAGSYIDTTVRTLAVGETYPVRVEAPESDFDPISTPMPGGDLTNTGNCVVAGVPAGMLGWLPVPHYIEVTGTRLADGGYEVRVKNVGNVEIQIARIVVVYSRLGSNWQPTTYSWLLDHASSRQWYGSQLYELPSSPWIQGWAEAAWIGGLLRDAGAFPAPLLGDVEILPDPRIQLGDVVRVIDRTGAALDTPAWVVGIRTAASQQGITQTLTLRGAAFPGPPTDVGLVPDPPVDPSAGSTA